MQNKVIKFPLAQQYGQQFRSLKTPQASEKRLQTNLFNISEEVKIITETSDDSFGHHKEKQKEKQNIYIYFTKSYRLQSILRSANEQHRNSLKHQNKFLQQTFSKMGSTFFNSTQKDTLVSSKETQGSFKEFSRSPRQNRLEILDKVLEIHQIMKMYEDTKNLSQDLGEYNKITLLYQLWDKLCEDDGRLQIYIKFLYKEVLNYLNFSKQIKLTKFIISDDSELVEVVQDLIQKQQNQTVMLKTVCFSEACYLLKSEVKEIQSREQQVSKEFSMNITSHQTTYQIMEKKYQEQVAKLQKEIEILRKQKEDQERLFESKLNFKENECINLSTQVQELRDTINRNQEAFESEKTDMQQRFSSVIHGSGVKIYELEKKVETHADKLAQTTILLENYKDRFHLAFFSLKQQEMFQISSSRLATQQVKNLRSMYSKLMNENKQLGIRAASHFEDLTPRPEFKPFILFLGFTPKENSTSREKMLQLQQHVVQKVNKYKIDIDKLQKYVLEQKHVMENLQIQAQIQLQAQTTSRQTYVQSQINIKELLETSGELLPKELSMIQPTEVISNSSSVAISEKQQLDEFIKPAQELLSKLNDKDKEKEIENHFLQIQKEPSKKSFSSSSEDLSEQNQKVDKMSPGILKNSTARRSTVVNAAQALHSRKAVQLDNSIFENQKLKEAPQKTGPSIFKRVDSFKFNHRSSQITQNSHFSPSPQRSGQSPGISQSPGIRRDSQNNRSNSPIGRTQVLEKSQFSQSSFQKLSLKKIQNSDQLEQNEIDITKNDEVIENKNSMDIIIGD